MTKIADVANILCRKIAFESDNGTEIPLVEFIDLGDMDQSFEKEGKEIIDEANTEVIDMESVGEALMAGLRKLIEGFILFFEKTANYITRLVSHFSVIGIRIRNLRNKIKDAKSIKAFTKLEVEGQATLGYDGKYTGLDVGKRLSEVTELFADISQRWPKERKTMYDNLSDVLRNGRDIKNVDTVLTSMSKAAQASSLDKEERLKFNDHKDNKVKFTWRHHRELVVAIDQLETLQDNVRKFASTLDGHVRRSFALKNKINEFLRNYKDMSEDTDFNKTTRDVIQVYLTVSRDDFKLMSQYGNGFITKAFSLINAAYAAAEKESGK